MSIPLSAKIETVRARLESAIGTQVIIGTPDEAVPGLYLFPYALTPQATFTRGQHPVTNAGQGGDPNPVLKCLLLPNPATDYQVLDAALSALHQQPVLDTPHGKLRITLAGITFESLAQIFLAAGMSLRLAIVFELSAATN